MNQKQAESQKNDRNWSGWSKSGKEMLAIAIAVARHHLKT